MYITINDIKGEKRIDLSYSIQNFDSDKECLGASPWAPMGPLSAAPWKSQLSEYLATMLITRY